MGRINFGARISSHRSENTKQEYDNEISYELLAHKTKQIALVASKNSNQVCYLLGMGAHPRSTYEKFSKENGLEVVWFSSALPNYLFFLRGLVASYEGLLKVLDYKKLPEAFLKLVDNSMAGIYMMNKAYEADFVKFVTSSSSIKNYDFGIKRDPSYFYYIVDADNAESKTGIYEIVSYGMNAREISSFL